MAASPQTDHPLKELALLVRQGRFEETRDWLEAGKPFRATSYRSAKPLRAAASSGFYSIIRLFLAQDLSQDELNQMLQDVVYLGREDLVRLLLESGANANSELETFSSALSSGNPGIVRLFIEHGADLKSGKPLAWAFGKYPHRSLVGIFKDLLRKDPSFIEQATQALNEQLTAKNEKWISLLLWIGADPRLLVDDLEIEDYKRSPLECAVRMGNLAFLKKARLDPKRDDIVQLLFSADWTPRSEVVQYLLSFDPDICSRDEHGESLIESYFAGLHYSWNISWRADHLDQIVACIELLAKHGAKWTPSSRTSYDRLRAALRKIERYKAISILERFVALNVFGPGTFRILMATPKMKDFLVTDTLRLAAGQKVLGKARHRVNQSR